jgi:hypothetical protein
MVTQKLTNMNFIKIIIVLLVVSSSIYVQARKKKSVSDTNITKTVSPENKLNTDSMLNILNEENITLKDKERKLRDSNSEKEQTIKSRDAEIILLKNQLIQDSIKIRRLNTFLIFADTIIARISNDCLRKKYDSVRVKEALVYFGKMYSRELQNKFSPLEQLLKQYSNYSKEISSILVEAENDREIKNTTTGKNNPFTGKEKAQSYIGKIKSTRYYQDIYDTNWTIPYLNGVIDKVINYLNAFEPKESEEFRLLDKMN